MKNIIRNAVIYSAALPSLEALEEHLRELQHKPIGEHDLESIGFVENPVTNRLVTPLETGLSITLRIDRKVIPGEVVRRVTEEHCKELEKQSGQKITARQRREIKEATILGLAREAFHTTSYIHAFYHRERSHLIVATSSKKDANALTSALVHVVGSIKTETTHVSNLKHGLTTRLTSYIHAGDLDAFGAFNLGDYCKMKGDGESLTFQREDIISSTDGVIEALRSGFQVESIALEQDAALTFRLTSDFRMKQVRIAPSEDVDEDLAESEWWRHEAAMELSVIGGAIDSLVEMVEYKEGSTGGKAA